MTIEISKDFTLELLKKTIYAQDGLKNIQLLILNDDFDEDVLPSSIENLTAILEKLSKIYSDLIIELPF